MYILERTPLICICTATNVNGVSRFLMANNEIVTWHWQLLCLPASIVGLWACNQALLLPWDSINWVLGTVPVCMSEEIIQSMQRQRSVLGTFLPKGGGGKHSLPNFLA